MTTQQSFKGASLEEVLKKVKSEVGPTARVTKAERTLKGGIAGFFAKEQFEVIVEIPTEKLNTSYEAKTESTYKQEKETIKPSNLIKNQDSKLDSVGSLSDSPFDKIMTELTKQADEKDSSFDETLTYNKDYKLNKDIKDKKQPNEESVKNFNFDKDDLESWWSLSQEQSKKIVSPKLPLEDGNHTDLHLPMDPQLISKSLAQLGLPPSLIPPHASAEGIATSLLHTLSYLPMASPLPKKEGSVVAVVGDLENSWELAQEVAEDMKLDPTNIYLASQSNKMPINLTQSITSATDAKEKVIKHKSENKSMIVVVDLKVSNKKINWARHILSSLNAEAIWAVVDATIKAEDILNWTSLIGGVDAICLKNASCSSSPASILATEIPVAFLDEHPATPGLWSAMLTQRIFKE